MNVKLVPFGKIDDNKYYQPAYICALIISLLRLKNCKQRFMLNVNHSKQRQF